MEIRAPCILTAMTISAQSGRDFILFSILKNPRKYDTLERQS